MKYYKLGAKASSFHDPSQREKENKMLLPGQVKPLDLTIRVTKYFNGGGLVLANTDEVKTFEIKREINTLHLKLNKMSVDGVSFLSIILKHFRKEHSWRHILIERDKAKKAYYETESFFENCKEVINCLFQMLDLAEGANLTNEEVYSLKKNDVLQMEEDINHAYRQHLKKKGNIKSNYSCFEDLFREKYKPLLAKLKKEYMGARSQRAGLMVYSLGDLGCLYDDYKAISGAQMNRFLNDFLERIQSNQSYTEIKNKLKGDISDHILLKRLAEEKEKIDRMVK